MADVSLPSWQTLLKGVSRSFYLSIRVLPAQVRPLVGLAYLLARASDSLADAGQAPAAQRLQALAALQQALAQAVALAPVLEQATHWPDLPGHERRLLQRLPALLAALHQCPEAERTLVQAVLRPITLGQSWDVQTFGSAPGGVPTPIGAEDTERYTWQVAGCVGLFWTEVCALHLHQWRHAPVADLRRWGQHHGQALQRLNILRDLGADLALGRCYLDGPSLAQVGLDPARLQTAVRQRDRATLQPLTALLQVWHARIREGLLDGLRYSQGLRGWRLRLASALPALLGLHTLAALQAAGLDALWQPVRIPRTQVYALLARLLLAGVSDRALQAQAQRAQA